jgi:hypothetical protein
LQSTTHILSSSNTSSHKLPAAGSISGAPLPEHAPSNSSSDNLLDDAVKLLSDRELETLGVLQTSCDIGSVVEQAVAAAKEKQRCCEETRGAFKLAGKTFNLKDGANKIFKLLDRFKYVGDIAAGADPVHFGLAWAGFRLLLDVRVV